MKQRTYAGFYVRSSLVLALLLLLPPQPGLAKQGRYPRRARALTTAAALPAATLGPLPSPPPLPTAYRGVALLPISRFDVEEAVVQEVETALLHEIDDLKGFQAISPTDVLGALAPIGLQPSDCDRDRACLTHAIRYARAHWGIEVRLTTLGGVLSIGFRLLDASSGNERERLSEILAEPGAPRLQQLHALCIRLLTPAEYTGGLTIVSPVAGAEVTLDNVSLGQTPVAPQQGVPAGLHILHLVADGHQDVWRFVEVPFQRAVIINIAFDGGASNETLVALLPPGGLGTLRVTTQLAGVEVRVDGSPLGVTPLADGAPQVHAGIRRLTLRRSGQPVRVHDVTVLRDQVTDLEIYQGPAGLEIRVRTPVILQPAMVLPAPFLPSWRSIAGISLLGAGAAAATLGAYYSYRVHSLNAASHGIQLTYQHAKTLEQRQTQLLQLHRQQRDGQVAQRRQWLAYGTSGGLALLGSGFLAWDLLRPTAAHAPLPSTAAPRLVLRPQAGSDGLGLQLLGAF